MDADDDDGGQQQQPMPPPATPKAPAKKRNAFEVMREASAAKRAKTPESGGAAAGAPPAPSKADAKRFAAAAAALRLANSPAPPPPGASGAGAGSSAASAAFASPAQAGAAAAAEPPKAKGHPFKEENVAKWQVTRPWLQASAEYGMCCAACVLAKPAATGWASTSKGSFNFQFSTVEAHATSNKHKSAMPGWDRSRSAVPGPVVQGFGKQEASRDARRRASGHYALGVALSSRSSAQDYARAIDAAVLAAAEMGHTGPSIEGCNDTGYKMWLAAFSDTLKEQLKVRAARRVRAHRSRPVPPSRAASCLRPVLSS